MSLYVNTTHSAIRLGRGALCPPAGWQIFAGAMRLLESNWSELELRLLCARRRCFDAPICMAGRRALRVVGNS